MKKDKIKKHNLQKQNDSGIQSAQLRANTGESFIFGCKLNVLKKEKPKKDAP